MLRGFYTAASGMISQQRQQEVLSNNIANANTPGFRADQTPIRAFPEMLMQQIASKNIPTKQGLKLPTQELLGSMNTGAYIQETIADLSQGDLRETGVSTDLAIAQGSLPDEAGSLFFTVENDAGEDRYTRNGNFTVDEGGFLVTNQGAYLKDTAGNRVETNGMDFSVESNGTLVLADGSRIPLNIAYAEDAHQLKKEGNDLYSGETVAAPGDARFTIEQGNLEGSNVDTMQSMTQMMNAYRSFESNQKVLKAYDESMGKAVSEIGRI